MGVDHLTRPAKNKTLLDFYRPFLRFLCPRWRTSLKSARVFGLVNPLTWCLFIICAHISCFAFFMALLMALALRHFERFWMPERLNILKFTCRKSCLWQFLSQPLPPFSRKSSDFSMHYRPSSLPRVSD